LQDEVTHRRVRGGHVVEAVHGTDLLVQRAAHDEPHHELYSLGPRLAHVFDVRHVRKGIRLVDQAVDKIRVPRPVDETCSESLQLVTHFAGDPDLYVQVSVEGIDCLATSLPQLIAAAARGRRITHHIHRRRNYADRPGRHHSNTQSQTER